MSVTQLTWEALLAQLESDTGLTTASGSSTTTTGTVAAGSNELTVAVATSFSAGQGISIAGAGTRGGILVTWIESINGLVFTLHAKAITNVSGAVVSHDDRFVIPIDNILPAGANLPAEFPCIALRMDGAIGENFPGCLSGMYFLYVYYQSEPGSSGQPLTVLNLICDRVRDLLHHQENDISNSALTMLVLMEIWKSGIMGEPDIPKTTHFQAMHYEYMSQLL